ncbi:MAG TPA: carboxypeptidase-like regulatory domain-containing protein [Terriglobales bacterium]|nr:carboxypeptidase-like regulatory domain-containing protein [Terriglobales bacterium]
MKTNRSVIVSLAVLLLSAVGLAQTGTSSIRGTVVDPQDNVVAGATITITNLATSAARTQKAGPSGNYSFDFITPGEYRVEAEAPNFRKTIVDSVHALIDHPIEVPLKLEVGATSETVSVSAEAVQVNTQDSNLGNNFVSQQITQLPMEARNVLSLLTLQPGVTKDGYVAGARSDQSNVTLDGVDVNDAQNNSISSTSPALNGPVLRLNSEAIQEFRVSTVSGNNSSGHSSGAQISLVTKSGTNNFHGSLFEYNRERFTEANTWWNNHNGVARPALIRNTFGASAGGPIKKNKLFFFYNYEGRRDAASAPVTSARLVPLPSLAAGNVIFPTAGGSQTTLTPSDLATIFPDTGGVDPAALKGLAQGTKYGANAPGGDGLNVGAFFFNAPAPVKLNSHLLKFDYNLTASQTLFARLNVQTDHDASFMQPAFPDTPAPSIWSHPWGIAVGHTWSISSTLVNNLHYGLTREAYTQGGDQHSNVAYFRIVYQPSNLIADVSRVTPVHNVNDDVSWIRAKHTWQFGGDFIAVSNSRVSFSSSYDTAVTNPSGYKTGLIVKSIDAYLADKNGCPTVSGCPAVIASSFNSSVENAVTALLGRFTQYTANFLFDNQGNPQASGTAALRDFATQGYEGYAQDIWKIKPNLTFTYGVRYSLWRPVYETNGYEVQPQIPLGQIYQNRVNAMNQGQAYLQDIIINKSGPANGGPPMYSWDKTNFLPHVALAYEIKPGTVLRGGFAMLNDYFGESIATFFDQRNTLGFSSATVIPVNTYNVGCGQYVVQGFYAPAGQTCVSSPGPQWTSFNQDVRSMPGITVPGQLTFPLQKSEQKFPTRIESSLDSNLTTPKNYAWSFTIEHQLPKNTVFQVSYIGRLGRNLLAQRDIAQPADLKDPGSGVDWYGAATILEKARQAGTPPAQMAAIPFFEHFWNVASLKAGGVGCPPSVPNCTATQAIYNDAYAVNGNDWTTTMLDIDGLSNIGAHAFYQPQYGALATWATIGNSTYNALTASLRTRMRFVSLDFNYTWSHSLDDESGLQSVGSFSSSSLILNAFRQRDNYASSDFDMRHVINVASVIDMPFGRGRSLLSNAHGVLEAVAGGWQVTHVFRFNTGLPFGTPIDSATWSTNWENQSEVTMIKPLPVSGCLTQNVATPKFFGNCLTQAFDSFRSSYPGETGQRNWFRYPGFMNVDMGLGKSWHMPWGKGGAGGEGHQLQFRAEVFNLTNTQNFASLAFGRTGWGIPSTSPGTIGSPSPDFANMGTSLQTANTGGYAGRVMQFGLHYSF